MRRGSFFGRSRFRKPGSVAQLVERTTENREVTGSTPVGATVNDTEICPGCGHPMSDHVGPNGEFVSIPVDYPSTEVPLPSERDHLWELHDRGYMSDADYEAEMRRLDG
jgi:hypothetical protein